MVAYAKNKQNHSLEACAWTLYIGSLFCHPDRSRILSGEAEGSTRVSRSPEPSRRGFLFASFQEIASIYLAASMVASSNGIFPAAHIVPSIASR